MPEPEPEPELEPEPQQQQQQDDDHDREGAYSLETPAQHVAYYDRWAATYDADFAQHEGYTYPANLVKHYLALAGPDDGPVADIGCGTGLAGAAFAAQGSALDVDGLDISPGMLEQARAKPGDPYRALHVADLTDPSTLPGRGGYGGLVSSGTFTFGHLGPAELETALLLGRPNALCVLVAAPPLPSPPSPPTG